MRNLFTIDTYFVHKKLVQQLLPSAQKKYLELRLLGADNFTFNLKDLYIHHTFVESAVQFLIQNKIPSLEELLFTEKEIRPGVLVWFENNFYFKGVVKARDLFNNGLNPSYAYFHTTLERYGGLKIEGRFNVEHLFGTSSSDRLSGQKAKFILGYVDEVSQKIAIRPILIGDRILSDTTFQVMAAQSLKVDIEDIDEFAEAKAISFRDKSLDININQSLPEKEIKKWFAEILNEGQIPKDWGGETSDLFTNHIHVNGKRNSAAFLLKGPSKFHAMTVKDLGVNGNQIVRLFDEPADIYILQHCHYIKPEIYKTMEAFAANFHSLKRYCIIDGIDTLRILKAYNKI